MSRYYYSSEISKFLVETTESILGTLVQASDFAVTNEDRDAWLGQIDILKRELKQISGTVIFEFNIPRLGQRIDNVIITGNTIFVIEFKVGLEHFSKSALNQVWDYALDLKHFHEPSHSSRLIPILICTGAKPVSDTPAADFHSDQLSSPISLSQTQIGQTISRLSNSSTHQFSEAKIWQNGRYLPTPTIIEAAKALYSGHNVEEISRSGADETNLSSTSSRLEEIIKDCSEKSRKAICFVTGVPGAGKTLVGLDIATKHFDPESDLYSVFLSGNGPLVRVLIEALAQDKAAEGKRKGKKITLSTARSEVKAFIQNVHHFRDDGLHSEQAPPEHVALFDEAQRAWNTEKTADFMKRKRNLPDFKMSEPEFLISCMDRHKDWAVIVCLVGGGQEIHTGEAGISSWIEARNRSFPHWDLYVSPNLTDSEYLHKEATPLEAAGTAAKPEKSLHLNVSMRSFRAKSVSKFVKHLLDVDIEQAKDTFEEILPDYPLVITRDLHKAKSWLRENARGNERFGVVVSSQAARLKPQAIDIRPDIDPVHWFLKDQEDVRSSYYLEDVATEFHIQGLELDWACLTWDGDFRKTNDGWSNWSFKGSKWQRILKAERQLYQKNAYRVLMTRARQGMIITVPEGNKDDPTRLPDFYDPTFEYLQSLGLPSI